MRTLPNLIGIRVVATCYNIDDVIVRIVRMNLQWVIKASCAVNFTDCC